MGGYPFNALQRVRYADMLRRYLGEDIEFGSVSPELAVGIIQELDRPEWFFLRQETLWGFATSIGANAANVGHVECLVPAAATDLIVVVEDISVAFTGASTYDIRYDGAAGSAIINNDVRDTRLPGLKARSQNAILNTTVGVSGILLDRLRGVVGGNVQFTQFTSPALPFVLTAGHRLQVWDNTQNEQLNVAMGGYEISLPLASSQG
jgi:hypothetical protein